MVKARANATKRTTNGATKRTTNGATKRITNGATKRITNGETKRTTNGAKGKGTEPRVVTTDPHRAYEEHLPAAMALAASSVPIARAKPSLARANVDRAVRALAPYRQELRSIAPRVDHLRLAALPALARAFEYADSLVFASLTSEPRGSESLTEALTRVAPLRLAALSYLDAAAFAGLVDGARVRKIREGRGRLDLARDAVAIAGLFEDARGALAGKHPFTQEQLAELRDTGAWLVERLKPSGAPRDARARTREAQIKDRFAKLVEDAYGELEKAAVQIWGVGGFRAHVPALYSFTTRRRKEAASPTLPVAPADGAPV